MGCHVSQDGNRSLSLIYLTGVFLEYLFVLASAVDGKALEDFIQRTDLTRSLF